MSVAKPVHRRPGGTLYRYLILEMVFPTLFTLGGLTIVILTKDLLSFSDMVINRGLSLADVGAIALFQMLPVVARMLPFAVLVGGLVALGRLGADRELLVLEASGISSPRLLGPVTSFATVMLVLGLFLSLYVSPWANNALDRKFAEVEQRNPGAAITPGTIHRFGDWMLQAREVSSRGDEMRGVYLWLPSVGETVFAESGALEAREDGGNRVVLERGRVLLNPRKVAREIRFDRMAVDLPRSADPLARNLKDRLGGATLAELLTVERDPSLDRGLRYEAGLSLQRRFALPVATLVFGLLIVPLFLARAHFSRSGGGVLGLLATLVYYGLAQFGESMVYDERLTTWSGAWLPNAVLGALAGIMALRMTRMTAFGRHADRPSHAVQRRSRAERKPAKLRAHAWALQRYVALRFLQMAGICFAVVLVGYLLIDVLDRMSWLGKYGATLEQVMRYYGARIPLLASRVVPMSLLVATALTVSVLAAQGELTGMRTNGIPAPRGLLPILLICALIAPAYFVLNNEVLPNTNTLASYLKDVVKHRTRKNEGLGAWFRVGDRFFQADRLDPDEGTARRITVFELGENGLPTARSDAVAATHIGNGFWRLVDPVLVRTSEEGLRRERGPSYTEIGSAIQANVDTRHLSVGELRREIEEVEASGLDATHYQVDLFVKLASPLACLVLPALALFFAVGGPPHPSSALTLVLSAVVAVAYVLLTGVGTSLGYGGAVAPWIAGWSPIVCFSALALYLGLRLRGFGLSF